MKIAVKFCGGCNPRIRRRRIIKKVKNNFKQDYFEVYQREANYDLILAVNGCSSTCGLNEELKNNNRVLIIGGLNLDGRRIKDQKVLLDKIIAKIDNYQV